MSTEIPIVRKPGPAALLTRIGLGVAVLAVLLVLLAGPGSRWGLWHFHTGLQMLGWGAHAAVAAFVLCLVAAVMSLRGLPRRSPLPALAGMVLALAAFLPPFLYHRTARAAPPIHDITTDTRNPPAFVAIAPLRAEAPNPSAYEGDSIAVQQVRAYPDIRPVMMLSPPDSAYDAALAAALAMGWEVVDVNKGQGRIEASDRTFWFGFVDDVVIRVMPASGISRVDVRSLSRVGKSDAGTNARRIRDYVEKLAETAKARGIQVQAEPVGS